MRSRAGKAKSSSPRKERNFPETPVDTVTVAFARRALDAARDHPERQRAILAAADVSAEALESPGARISALAFSTIWNGVNRALDDEFFGVDSRQMKSGTFSFICRALIHERSVRDAVVQCLFGLRLFLDDVTGVLLESDREAAIRIETRITSPAKRLFATELLVTMVYGTMCWLAGRRIPLTHVEFAFPRPSYAREYTFWLSDNLAFDAEATVVRFDRAVLNGRVTADGTSLREFLRSWPRSVFVKYRSPRGWAHRVRHLLRSVAYEDWPDIATLARELKMAASTLQRRLYAEGTTYSLMKVEARRALAIRLLTSTELSIQDIASRAGYRDISAFYRAFRHWTGRAPGDYRAELQSF